MSDAERQDDRKPADPKTTRDHLANERTAQAWVRSGLAIMVLGVVVWCCGLLIQEVGPQAPRRISMGFSTGVAVALVAGGAVLIALATRRYRSATRAIEQNTYQPSEGLILALAGGTVLVAALLVVSLLLTV